MSNEIVDVLSTYDMTRVFKLDAFKIVLEKTRYNNELLKRETFESTIMFCFIGCTSTFSYYVADPFLFWIPYIPHNAKQSLLNYVNILQNLKKEKGASIQFSKYLVRSMLGFLFYANYKESNKRQFLRASKRLIQKSLNLDNSCVKLRAATFFLTNIEYRQSIEICDTFLNFQPIYRIDGNYIEWVEDIHLKVFQLLRMKTTDGIEKIMTEILPMFSSSVKLKSLPGSYNITQPNLVWIFRNFTNIFFHDLEMDVAFMTAEKWVVPDPIQYELLSLSQDVEIQFSVSI